MAIPSDPTILANNRAIVIDYERDPYTDHNVIRGMDRRIGGEYGQGAADTAELILSMFDEGLEAEEIRTKLRDICISMTEYHRIVRIELLKERFAISDLTVRGKR
jgi:hypothetical protein